MKKLSLTLVSLFFALAIVLALIFTIDDPKYDMILNQRDLLVTAFLHTIFISLTTLVGALLLGFILFVMLRSSNSVFYAFSYVFNEIIMGTPLLVMIFLVVYVFGAIIGYNDKLVLGIVALVLYNSPYVANAYETTAAVVDQDQYTVMDLYHFTAYQKYRYIIIPQMIRPFIPSLINNLSSVIKGSALLNIIAVSEITYVITSIASRNFAFIEGYYIMWLLYLMITIPLSMLAKHLGKKVKP